MKVVWTDEALRRSSAKSGSALMASRLRALGIGSPSARINARCPANASAALASASSSVSPAEMQPGTSGKLAP
jgi:hypothetical protein